MEGNSLKLFENLAKIFETRIRLDHLKHVETPEDVLINYEKYCKKIDNVYNDDFEKEVKPLIAKGVTIEEEEERLKKLIKLLEDRLEKREKIENRFYTSVGSYLNGLQMIVSDSELSDKKNRLELITKYLDTKKEIEEIASSIGELENNLAEEEKKRDDYLPQNKEMEDELYELFNSIIKDDEFFKELNDEDINSTLASILDKVKEAKDTLEVTKDSVRSLSVNGINDDYSVYVEDAEKSYFVWKNREILLKIYEIVIKFEESFEEIYEKRKKISSYMKKRKDLIETLNIKTKDELNDFDKLLVKQIDTLNNEKEVLDNIANYISRINFKEQRLSELDSLNNNDAILSILREYGLVDIYAASEVEDTKELDEGLPTLDLFEDDKVNEVVKEVIDPYRIVEVKNYPITLNIGLARLKGESVRDKIMKKLNLGTPKEESFDLNIENKDNTVNENSNIPVWSAPEDINNNAFWTPVSDDKLDANEFPNINIPITDLDSNIDFPVSENN